MLLESNCGTVGENADHQASLNADNLTNNRMSVTSSCLLNDARLSRAVTQTGNTWLMTSSGDDVMIGDVSASRGHYGGGHSFSISRLMDTVHR